MIKSPKANNGSSIKVGNLQSQPVKNNVQNHDASNVRSDGEIPIIGSSLQSKNVNNRKLTSFEESSNISEERPETIMMTSFNPLYDDQENKTEFGDLFDVYVEALRHIDATSKKLLEELDDKNFVKNANENLKIQITQLRNRLLDLNNVLKTLGSASSNLNLHNSIYTFSPSEFISRSFNEDGKFKTRKSSFDDFIDKLQETLSISDSINQVLKLSGSSKNFVSTKLWIVAVNELRNLLESHSTYLLKDNQKEDNSPSNINSKDDASFKNDVRIKLSEIQKKAGGISSVKDVAVALATANASSVNLAPSQNSQQLLVNFLEATFSSLDSIFNRVKDDESRVALVFHLISKEIKHSFCYDANSSALKSFRGPGQQAITSDNFFDSIFGAFPSGKDSLQKNIDLPGNSLIDFAYSRNLDDQSKSVLTFEQTHVNNISEDLVVGGKYFFDVESLFEGITSTSLNTVGLAKLDEIQKTTSRLDNNFFNLMSNFGLLPVNDDLFDNIDSQNSENSSKPSYVSLNSLKFIENVLSLMTDQSGLSKIYENELSIDDEVFSTVQLFKQAQRGIGAIFAEAAKDNPKSRKIRAALMLLILEIVDSVESPGVYDQQLYDACRSLSTDGLDIQQSVKDDIDSFSTWLVDVFKQHYDNSGGNNNYNVARTASINSLKELYEESKNGEIASRPEGWKYIPCKYDDASFLGSTIRQNKFIQKICDVIKETRDIFIKYACKNNSTSVFSKIETNTIVPLFFYGICKLIEMFTNNLPVAIRKDDNTLNMNIINSKAIDTNAAEVGATIGSTLGVAGALIGYAAGTLVDSNLYHFDPYQALVGELGLINYGLVIYVNIDATPKDKKKKEIEAQIEREVTKSLLLSVSILNFLDTFNSNIQKIYTSVNKFNKESISYLSNFVTKDSKKLSLLLREPQLMLMLSSVEDIYQSSNSFSDDIVDDDLEKNNIFTKYVESLPHSNKMVDLLERFFKNSEYSTKKGYNKKILSVGIPQGLFKKLLNTPNLSTKNNKHNDIFKIVIYKMDLLNSDIIYKPKEYLFEASRYPVRTYSQIQPIKGSSYEEIYKVIPTRNYSLFTDPSSTDFGSPTYWNDKTNSFGKDYDFLTNDEKKNLLENHINSFLLENYLKILTGLSISDINFNLDSRELENIYKMFENDELKKKVSDSHQKIISNSLSDQNSGKKTLSSSTIANSMGISKKQGVTFTQTTGLSGIKSSQNLKSFYSTSVRTATFAAASPDAYITKMIQPKKFDRVFNIIFDPEFQVDFEKTSSTKMGSSKLDFFVRQKKIKKVSNNVFVDEDKTFQDPSMDCFFIVLETHSQQNIFSTIIKPQNTKAMISQSINTALGRSMNSQNYRK